MVAGFPSIPHWLQALLSEKFFNPCPVHESAKKNEKNILCLDCCLSICPHCLSPHRSHRLLQIRRYVYHDVIRVDDVDRLLDCSFVQSYTTNSAKVVFLNQRPQSRPFRGSGNICTTCDRSLQDPYLFCSVACKIHHLVRMENGLNKFQFLPPLPKEGVLDHHTDAFLEEDDFDEEMDGQMTPDSILESRISLSGGGGGGATTSSATTSSGAVSFKACALVSTATTEFVTRKKRSSVSACRATQQQVPYRPVTCSLSSDISGAGVSRRKSTPHRAPLY
ncbi:hypothetical protein Scep_006816 [Stephania cephalantha]|uniref:B box-type domain-containing protein n=1 Tax=Stephania cephalantha TaxID=152367 RepID=A0AAP0PML2_9MAGN